MMCPRRQQPSVPGPSIDGNRGQAAAPRAWDHDERVVALPFIAGTKIGASGTRQNVLDCGPAQKNVPRRMTMRELDEEERHLLRALDGPLATGDLIAMVRDLGEILRNRGHVIQANVAELAADRLETLDARAHA